MLMFRKSLKIWLYHLTWGFQGKIFYWLHHSGWFTLLWFYFLNDDCFILLIMIVLCIYYFNWLFYTGTPQSFHLGRWTGVVVVPCEGQVHISAHTNPWNFVHEHKHLLLAQMELCTQVGAPAARASRATHTSSLAHRLHSLVWEPLLYTTQGHFLWDGQPYKCDK